MFLQRALIGASAASQIGNWLYNAALLGPAGGAIADRYSRRAVLLVGDVLRLEMDSRLLRVEGHALLEALEGAPALRRALDLSSTAPGVKVPAGETRLIDDPRWVEA